MFNLLSRLGADMIQLNVSELNEDFKELIKTKLEALREKAPSDSNVVSRIEKFKKGYTGVLEVFSSQGHFIAQAFEVNPLELTNSLLRQIYDQITRWKKIRFLAEA